ncbi:MAG: hypothetical protein QW594_03040 [Candidatus Woesearchaeota archaeon]
MEFKIKTFAPGYYHYSEDEISIAYKFSKEALKEFGKFVKSVVIFGSLAKQHALAKKKTGDIDILLIVDDVSVIVTQELLQTYDLLCAKISHQVSPRIHLTTLPFTSFWEFARAGDPLVINILRDGMPLFDTGFFSPLQKLLYQGRIRPTEESIWAYYSRSPKDLASAKGHLLQACIDLYWACINAAHAALMRLGEIPPSPDHVADMLENKLVRTKLLDKQYVHTFKILYKLQKMIVHREIEEITGQQYDTYYREAEQFVKAMEKIVDKPTPQHQKHT